MYMAWWYLLRYTQTRTGMYIYTHTHILKTHTCTHLHTCTHTHITTTHTNTHSHTHTLTHTHIHKHTCTHTHTHIPTHPYMCMHTQNTNTLPPPRLSSIPLTGLQRWLSVQFCSPSRHYYKRRSQMTHRMPWWPGSTRRTPRCIRKLQNTGHKSMLVVSNWSTTEHYRKIVWQN